MIRKIFTVAGVTAFAAASAFSVFAADESDEAAAVGSEEALIDAEVSYVQALIDAQLPDFAEPVIAEVKKKWPAAEAKLFAAEISGLLALNKFDEAERRIASLPDRNSSKYWAARLTEANYFAALRRTDECMKIYDEFFAKFATPPKDMFQFYIEAKYAYGQLLVRGERIDDAIAAYSSLLPQLKDGDQANWCTIAVETCDLLIRKADALGSVKARAPVVAEAQKIIKELLWKRNLPLFFGRAISMSAHCQLLLGNVNKAQEFVQEYLPMLKELHDSIVAQDPDGRAGLLRSSPMPQCRYLLAEMLWKNAQDEFKKPKHDDNRIKDMLFGARVNGKRNGAGAYNHALNVFIQHPESPWAVKAADLADAIENFAMEKYEAKITKKIGPEQLEKLREMQFQNAENEFLEGNWAAAVKLYEDALEKYPECGKPSVRALENTVSAYHKQYFDKNNPASDEQRELWRLTLDAIEGYLSERFAGSKDSAVYIEAGDAVVRIAAAEKQFGEPARADRLYKAFLKNYRRHFNAPGTASALAGEAYRAENWAEALALYRIIGEYFPKSQYYVPSFSALSACYSKLGDKANAIATLKEYVGLEDDPLRRMQSQMRLAQMYQKDGLERIAAAATNESEEAVAKAEAVGSAQIIRGIQQFTDFAGKAKAAAAEKGVSKSDKKEYEHLAELALYYVGDCWSRLQKPAEKLEEFRKRAAENYETYVKEYPTGEYAKYAYVKLGTIYTALGDIEKSKHALERLAERFPDSDEAKNSKPRLARSLIEMGLKKEGAEIYSEMLRTDGKYTAWNFVQAGEALIEARSWDLANQSFEKAIRMAGTNSSTVVAHARIGEAKALYRQKNYAGAREALDQFLSDKRYSGMSMAVDAYFLLVEVASEQGRTERDDVMRGKDFGAAIGALKKVRQLWAKKEPWELDRTYLMSADVYIRRMQAEEMMGLKEKALESCARAASTLQAFLQSHAPDENHPFDKFLPGERENLERCYVTMVPLFAKLGGENSSVALRYGNEFLNLFPESAGMQTVQNAMNSARASGAVEEKREPAAEAAPAAEAVPAAETPAAAEAAEAAPAAEEKTSEENKE